MLMKVNINCNVALTFSNGLKCIKMIFEIHIAPRIYACKV